MSDKLFKSQHDPRINEMIVGKTVEKYEVEEAEHGPEMYLRFEFSDGTVLRIQYDYIYEVSFIQK